MSEVIMDTTPITTHIQLDYFDQDVMDKMAVDWHIAGYDDLCSWRKKMADMMYPKESRYRSIDDDWIS